jgi:hypothetical protein
MELLQISPFARAGRQTPDPPPSTKSASQVTFTVKALYGVAHESVQMPVNERESIDSGTMCLTMDPDADATSNVGIINFDKGNLVVRYGVQCVFPGLYDLVRRREYDSSLLHPIRAVATDRCTLNEDFTQFHAIGCLEFLPGSLWSGTEGG